MVKVFNLTPSHVLYEMSYANLILYSASLPSYKKPDRQSGEGAEDKAFNGDDPDQQAEIDKLFDESNRRS